MMTLHYTLFIVVFHITGIELKLEPLSQQSGKLRHSLTQCVMSAAKEFENTDIITVSLATKDFIKYSNSTTATDKILLQALYQKMDWTLLVTKSTKLDKPSRLLKKSDNYIIQIRDSDEFSSILKFLVDRPSWNPHARFIILTSSIFKEPTSIVASVVESLWESRVLNAIIMVPQKEASDNITIYSWFPFSNSHCGDGFDETDIINFCNYGKLLNNTLLFPNKIPNDMNKCPIKVRAVIWPPYIIPPKKIMNISDVNFTEGIEILLLNTIAEAANFSLIYSVSKKEQNWGFIWRNKSGTGMMKTIFKEEAVIGVGALASLQHRHYHFDTSVTYLQEAVTWCIPHAMPEPKWKCLLIIFKYSTWMSIVVSFIFINLSIKLLVSKHSKESTTYINAIKVLQNTYCIMLGLTVKTLPNINITRFLIMLWIGACLTLNAAYQSSLISFLTTPSFEEQAETFDQLLEMKYSFGLVPPTFKFIKDPEKGSNIFQIQSWKICDDVKVCLDRTAYQRDFVVAVPRMFMVYSSKVYINRKGENLVYWSKHNIISYPIEMIMVKGCPFLSRINQLIFRIQEAGLISKWIDDFLKKPKCRHKEEEDVDDDVILTAKHLEGSFIVLGIGLSISSLILICEIFYYKYYV